MTPLNLNLRRGTVLLLAGAMLAAAVPAMALEGEPQGHKQRERHVFRDAQLGLSHPSTHGRSTQTTAPPKPLFPWLLPPANPGASTQGGGIR